MAILAEAVYLQGRLDEAQQMTEESQALAVDDDIDAQTRWRATRAKLLALHGQSPPPASWPTRHLAQVSETSYTPLLAETLLAEAELNRLACSPGQAADNLRAALRIYEDWHAVPLAARPKAALATLTAQPGAEQAQAPQRPRAPRSISRVKVAKSCSASAAST